MATVDAVLKKNLKGFGQYVALATVSAKRYQETNVSIIKYLVNKEISPGVYVTLNKPFKTMEKVLEKAKVDTRMILFIDAVTKTVGGVEKIGKCLYIGNPENLSDISIAMDQAVRALPGKKKFLFFDSLSTLLLYNTPIVVAKFIHFISGRMREWGVNGIIISLKTSDKELYNELMQFCDAEINFE